MTGRFVDLMAAADYLGPGAMEVDRYQTEIFDIVRRRGVFGQRIKQVPATGHPSRFFEETAIAAPTATQAFVDPRNIAPTVGADARGDGGAAEGAGVADQLQPVRSGSDGAAEPVRVFAGEGLGRFAVDGLMRTHDVALWNGTDTSLAVPTTPQYFGVIGQIEAGGNTVTVAKSTATIVHGRSGRRSHNMVANASYQVRPTAIYANPMLLDLIDQEMKAEFNVVLNTVESHGRVPREGVEHAGGRFAADSGVGTGIHGNAGVGSGAAGVHRDRGPDRVSLADRSESASVQAGAAQRVDAAAGGGEVWRSGGEGGELRALRSEGAD
jgi:hypothetical protein